MSATIYYRYVKNEIHIGVSAPSRFIERMTNVFGEYPWRLNESALPRLDVMAKLNDDGAPLNPYQAIHDVIERDGAIEVWPEY